MRSTAVAVGVGVVAVLGAVWLARRASAVPVASVANAGGYSWLSTSGSAENVFNRPYWSAQGRPDAANIDWDMFQKMNPGRPVFGR